MDSTQAPGPDELQFDTADGAEESSGPLACHRCERPLHDVYFEVDTLPSCERCRYEAESERGRGSGPGRFLRALMGGGFAGLLGAGIYYAVVALTGYEVGLVAIIVGFLVGFGVRWGSRGRGGWPYQVLAVGITYVAIVSTYVPFIFEEIQNMEVTEAAEPARENAVVPQPALPPETDAEAPVAVIPVSSEATEAVPLEGELTAGEAVVGLALFSLLILAVPFLGGFENIIGLLIIGFGLYQAWKINAHQPLVIEGPFQVGRPAPAVAPPPVEPGAS